MNYKLIDGFRTPTYYKEIADHAEAREPFYGRRILPLAKRLMRAQNIEVTVTGAEFIPAEGGALLAVNHTGYYDFILGGIPAYLRGRRLVRFMAKKSIFEVPVVGAMMRKMGHLPVDRSAGASSVEEAVARLRGGELVGIFPEGTISRSFELQDFKTGAARIAHEAGVPLVPVVIWGSQRIWTKGLKKNLGRSFKPVMIRVGAPIPLSGDPAEDTALLKEAMDYELGLVRAEYEKEYGPHPELAGWVPAAMGGGAPTIDEAKAIDAAARAQRKG